MDHPTHRINFYHDNRKRVVYCSVCSREEADLSTPCPGKFIPESADSARNGVDTSKEPN